MSFSAKSFVLGMVVGIGLTLGVLVGGTILLVKLGERMMKDIAYVPPPPSFPEQSGKLPIYAQADYAWSLRTLEGRTVQLAEFKDRVVFINLWATWCAPCVEEMPSMQKLYDSMKTEDVAFLFVSDESSDKVRSFLEKNHYTFPVYLSGEKTPAPFQVRGVPTTFVLDRSGAIVFKRVGGANWDHDSCRQFLRRLK